MIEGWHAESDSAPSLVGVVAGSVVGILAVWLYERSQSPRPDFGRLKDAAENCLIGLFVGAVIGATLVPGL